MLLSDLVSELERREHGWSERWRVQGVANTARSEAAQSRLSLGRHEGIDRRSLADFTLMSFTS